MAKRTTKAKRDVYQSVTDRILENLKNGTVPWRKAWSGKSGIPRSAATNKVYRGVNLFLLHCMGYEQPKWATYRQIEKLGGQVRKGESGSMVVFWKLWEKETETGPEKIPILRHYTVFNVEQCDGLDKIAESIDVETFEHSPIEQCEQLVGSFPTFDLSHGGARAFYSPSQDFIQLPNEDRFSTREEYYSTLFHELIHWTAPRLKRKFGDTYGDDSYAQEELIAEFGAAMLCGHCGIETATIENSSAYIAGWSKRIKADNKLVVRAAAAAQKAIDYLLGVTWDDEPAPVKALAPAQQLSLF